MIKQIKDTARAGVTLVELLVVILIVAILAVTMLPMFKKYVVQAQYTAEPIPLVGHIRTQIGLYQYEHNNLPWLVDENEGTSANNGMECVTFAKNSTGGYKVQSYSTAGKVELKDYKNESPLTKMDVSVNELIGKKISPDQVHLACTRNGASYCYAIGIFGKGGDGLPAHTGYAVMEAYFSTVKIGEKYVSEDPTDPTKTITSDENGYKFVGTWKNYTGDGTTDNGTIKFGEAAANDTCAIFGYAQFSTKDLNLAGVKTAADNLNSGAGVCGRWEFPEIPVAATNP